MQAFRLDKCPCAALFVASLFLPLSPQSFGHNQRDEQKRTAPIDVPDIFTQAGIADHVVGDIILFSPNFMLGDSVVLDLPYIKALRRRYPGNKIHVFNPWVHLLKPNVEGVTFYKIPRSIHGIDDIIEDYFSNASPFEEIFAANAKAGKRVLFLPEGFNLPSLEKEQRHFVYWSRPEVPEYLRRQNALALSIKRQQLWDFAKPENQVSYSMDYAPIFQTLNAHAFLRGMYNAQNTATYVLQGVKNVPVGLDAMEKVSVPPAVLTYDDFVAEERPPHIEPLPEKFVFFNLNASSFKSQLHVEYENHFRSLVEDIAHSMKIKGSTKDLVVTRPNILDPTRASDFLEPKAGQSPFEAFLEEMQRRYEVRIRVISDQPKQPGDQYLLQRAMRDAELFITHDTGLLHMAAIYRDEVDTRYPDTLGKVPRLISFTVGDAPEWVPPGGFVVKRLKLERDFSYQKLIGLVQLGLANQGVSFSRNQYLFLDPRNEGDMQRYVPPVMAEMDGCSVVGDRSS